MPDMIKRAAVAQACIDRFANKAYAPGKRDCAILAAHALHKMGHRKSPLKGVRYSNEAGAVRAMRKLGFSNLIAAVDSLGLERIAPAAALPGDLVALVHEDGAFGCALTVALDNGRVLGFQDGTAKALAPHLFVAAWRL